jgi:phenylalanyl-tRNA synthetase beta chain
MRPSPIPNLARAAQRNLDRGRGDARLFEVGPSYLGDGEGDQRRVIAAVHQPRPARTWRPAEPVDVFAIKAACLAALSAVGAPAGLTIAPANAAWLHPGRSGAVKLGPAVLALFGELHPKALAALDVEGPVLGFEIVLDAIPIAKAKAGRARPPLERLDLMPLSRDFAFLLEDAVPAADVVRAALGADKVLVADVRVFDLYRGTGVPEGKKSLAIEVKLQPRDKTLTDTDIETVSAKIIGAVAKATGGTLRG